MNPLTLVKRIQNINSKEAALGISEAASWHAKYKDSAYVFVGGIPFDLTEGDLLAVFAQYGEVVDVNLVRDKGTGKSKGFAFVAYEDQRSTNLAVDNLNGAQILGRIIRVDHVSKYKKKEEEDEEAEQQKREERGVCRAFQKGECNRGAGCKFSHNEQRAANTGWGPQDHRSSKWGHDNFEDSAKNGKQRSAHPVESSGPGRLGSSSDNVVSSSKARGNEESTERHHKRSELRSRDEESRGPEKRPAWKEKESGLKEDRDRRGSDRISRRHEVEENDREYDDRREEKRARRHEPESHRKEDRNGSRGDKRSTHHRDSSYHHRGGRDDDQRRSSQSNR